MSHTRFELGFPRHRKVFRLSDAAFRLWASAIDYSRDQRTDGKIEKADLAAIPRGTQGAWKPSVATELVQAGLWQVVDGGWLIHDFLDWQDSANEANQKKEAARERMRAVRANRKGTLPERSPTDHSLDPPSGSSGSGSQTGSTQPVTARDGLDLQAAAALWLSDPNRAALVAPKPEKWPETARLVAKLKAVFGGAEQAPRHQGDPRMRVLLTCWADGYQPEELERAIDGAKLDDHIRRHPQLQTLQTLLKDSAAISKYQRLLEVAPLASTRPTDGRAGDGLDRQVARAQALRELEDPEPKALLAP